MVVGFLQAVGWWTPVVVLFSIGVSMLLSQLVKYIIDPSTIRTLGRDGGMPSTHSAIIGSSLTGIFLVDGISMLFVFACAVGIIVLRDSFGVRFAVGENAKVLEQIAPDKFKGRVRVDEGHKPIQLVVGFALGVLVAVSLVFLAGASIF
ncbi:MAG: divergent PAP2 family protein [Candidatus Woesearchaeota archaeon]